MGRKKKEIVNNEDIIQITSKKIEGQTESQILEDPLVEEVDNRKNSLEGKFLHIKVGDKERPATDEDIKDIQEKIDKILKNNNINCAVLVTHHAVDINILG